MNTAELMRLMIEAGATKKVLMVLVEYIKQQQEAIEERREKESARKRVYRSRHKDVPRMSHGTTPSPTFPSSFPPTPPHITTLPSPPLKKEIRTVASATSTPNEDFEGFKRAYPKRLGGNPWAPARKLFEAAVRGGADPARMVGALRAGIGYDRGQVGTEFIPQAVKWLRDRRWEDWQPPVTGPPDPSLPSDEELRRRARERMANEQAGAGGNHEGQLLRKGAEIHRIEPGRVRDPPRVSGMVRLGELLPKASGVGAVGNEGSSDAPDEGDDGAGAVAPVVRQKLW